MTLHVSATTGCNLGCTYCYENPDRERKEDWVDREYDMEKIMHRLEEWQDRYPNEVPGLHGGEPLLMKNEDIEQIMKWVHDNYSRGGTIQTNATMMTEDHVDLISKYNWSVGISCDGPGELNKHRIAHEGGEDVTQRHTEKTIKMIHRLAEEGVSVGIITVLHKANAGTDEKLERLLDWIDELNQKGVTGHYNPAIPYEDVQEDISLSPERLKEVYLRTWEWIKEGAMKDYDRIWDPMRSYVDNLLGAKLTNCVNNKCDVYNAGAAKIIKGNGESTGCGKTWSGVGDGGAFLQGPSTGNEFGETEERYTALKQTPGPYTEGKPDMGGCKGCDYWNVCQGGCPSAGMNFDHRNRVIWCEAIYALYEQIEKDLRTLMPNITLITDFPWNAELSDKATRSNLDIEPFAAMDPGIEGTSSSFGNFEHPTPIPIERVPEEVLGGLTKEQRFEEAKNHYDEEVLVEHEHGYHADTNIAQKQTPPESTEQKTQQPKDDNETTTEWKSTQEIRLLNEINRYREKYDDRNISIPEDKIGIHADSVIPESESILHDLPSFLTRNENGEIVLDRHTDENTPKGGDD